MSKNIFLEKVILKSISIYPSTEEENVRIYIGCISEQNPEKKYSVINFFTEKKDIWFKVGNENFTLEKAFDALNSGTPVVAELAESSHSDSLFEGDLVFSK